MIGIYKISNNINGKTYIGCSVDITRRFANHRNFKSCSPHEEDKVLYRAFRKYGIENFTFSVIESCSKEELAEREMFYIKKYGTYGNGYNATPGGDIGSFDRNGEKHPNAKLSKEDVVEIRNRYKNLERKSEVYLLYSDRIGPSGFNKIWQGRTWKTIMPEVYTQENAKHHMQDTSNTGSANGKSILTEEDVKSIRLRKKNGENRRTVYSSYKDKITFGSFENVWYNQSWKHVKV